jgi:hypothetical protein
MDTERCYGESPPHTFNLSKRTYLLNLAQPGDFVLSGAYHDIARNIPALRQYLYLHGADDFAASPQIGETHFALFSGAQRAVGPSEYPNISYTLNSYTGEGELLPPNKNKSGVFKLSGSMIPPPLNVFSILPQDAARESWTLQQIIREVYEKEGIQSALFISTGCLVPCLYANRETPEEETVQRSVEGAARLMHIAHNEYTALKPVVTASELVSLGTQQYAQPAVLIPPAIQSGNNALRMYPELIGAEPFLDPLTVSRIPSRISQ